MKTSGFHVVRVSYGHAFIFNIRDSELLKNIINSTTISWLKEILVAIAIKPKA